jgi:VWFA-related protein
MASMRARRAGAGLVLLLLPVPVGAQVRIDEHVDVTRVLVDVRVTDSRGGPVRGLGPADFEVDLDGRRAGVEWVQWVGTGAAGELRTSANQPAGGVPVPSRQIVFLFQNGVSSSRLQGVVRMMRESERFVDRLNPGDQAAVLVFDSRLRVVQDFTPDHHRLRSALGRAILFEPPSGEGTDGTSLGRRLAAAGAGAASSPEQALQAIGRALETLPGAKALVLFGYGFGDLRAPFRDLRTAWAQLDRQYEKARDALVAAQVAVFALDVTNADFHSLETSLMDVADDTGGFYSRTHDFPAAAMDRLDGSLQGYYVLAVEKPVPVAARRGRHTIAVRTGVDGATVMARRYYVD